MNFFDLKFANYHRIFDDQYLPEIKFGQICHFTVA